MQQVVMEKTGLISVTACYQSSAFIDTLNQSYDTQRSGLLLRNISTLVFIKGGGHQLAALGGDFLAFGVVWD